MRGNAMGHRNKFDQRAAVGGGAIRGWWRGLAVGPGEVQGGRSGGDTRPAGWGERWFGRFGGSFQGMQAVVGGTAPGTGRAYVFQTYQESQHPGWTVFAQYDYWEEIYVDPATARVLGVVSVPHNWVEGLRLAHQQLLLRYEVGHLIVGTATLALLAAVMSSGLYLLPRTRAALRPRLTLKPNVRWRRRNYDLHTVGGFYG